MRRKHKISAPLLLPDLGSLSEFPPCSQALPLPWRVGCYQGAELQNIWKRHACIYSRGVKMDALGYNKH